MRRVHVFYYLLTLFFLASPLMICTVALAPNKSLFLLELLDAKQNSFSGPGPGPSSPPPPFSFSSQSETKIYSFQTISSQNPTSLVSATVSEKGRRIINNFQSLLILSAAAAAAAIFSLLFGILAV
jgi:hypothetical protein